MPKAKLPILNCRVALAKLALIVFQATLLSSVPAVFAGTISPDGRMQSAPTHASQTMETAQSDRRSQSVPTKIMQAAMPADPYALKIDGSTPAESSLLCDIARSTLERHFGGARADEDLIVFVESLPVPDKYKRAAGLFITLSENGHTRACWGSLDPQFPDLVKATVFTTEQALTDEYRFPRIKSSEVPFLHVQVTVVRRVEPLNNIAQQNPRLCGMLVKSGGKSGVILPGETTDPYYQMLKCKLKAGIKPGEPCLVYRIKADVNK